jgi:hypothetical protein
MNDEDRPTLGEVTDPVISDEAALDGITLLLSGKEWEAETIELVADLVRQTGRFISDDTEGLARCICRQDGCDREIEIVQPNSEGDFDYICGAGHVTVEPF